MVEQHPLIHHCLTYLLSSALKIEPSISALDRLQIQQANSLDYLQQPGQEDPDCYYLDPMFPTHKSGARPGKELQLLQKLTRNSNIEETFQRALALAKQRVVVKRPIHAAPLNDLKPDLQHRDKTIRFDVYLTG